MLADHHRIPSDADLPCLDAMILIHFNRTNNLELLEQIWSEGAFTPNVVREHEIGDFVKSHPENQRIMNADWLKGVEVEDPVDVQFAVNLRRAWGSDPGKDRGEADIAALCRRYGWIAVTDDRNGRGALRNAGCDRAYMVSMLATAVATRRVDLTDSEAWAVSQSLQSTRERPFLHERSKFEKCLTLFRALHEQNGRQPWPAILRDRRVDLVVEKLDGRR